MKDITGFTELYCGKRVLVLGAAGFIGRWVARLLAQARADAVLVVRESNAAEQIFRQYQVQCDVVEQDLRDGKGLRRLVRDVSPSIVFNLAGYGVDPAQQSPDIACDINARLVRDVAYGLAESGPANRLQSMIVHVGTAQEYGAAQGNLEESTRPLPTTLYGRSKLAGTIALTQACQELGLRGVTARLFTVYGPGEESYRLFPSLREAARIGSSLDLTPGDQLRDFTYVEDVAEGLLRLGQSQAVPGEIVNLATGVLKPVRTFVSSAARILKIPDERLHFGAVPVRAEEMNHAPVSVKRLIELLNWTPSTTIAGGIGRTLAFHGAQLGPSLAQSA